MGRALLYCLLGTGCLTASSPPAKGQGTLRPIPSVAHAWQPRVLEESVWPGGEASNRVPVDLDFIGPLEFDRVNSQGSGQDPKSTNFVELELALDALGSSDFQGGPGTLTTLRGGWKVALGRMVPEGLSFAGEVGTEAAFYDFEGSPVAGVHDPFNDVYDTHVAGRFLWESESAVSMYGGVEVGIAGEDAVGLDDSVYVGGALAMRYKAGDQFALLAGVAGVSRFDDSPWVLPYLGFDWLVTENVRLKTEAAEVHLEIGVGERWTVELEAVYEFYQYRLNQEGPLSGGSFREDSVRIGAAVKRKVGDGGELELRVGQMLWREVRFHDGASGDLGETEMGRPLTIGVGVSFGF